MMEQFVGVERNNHDDERMNEIPRRQRPAAAFQLDAESARFQSDAETSRMIDDRSA